MPTEAPVVVRCRALSLVVAAFVIFAAGVVPALGQDFDFMAVQRATIGKESVHDPTQSRKCFTNAVSRF